MATRLERGLRIFLLLQKGASYDALQLSKTMGVTRRTIFRDMALLKEMGLPVAYDTKSASYSYDTQRVGHQFQIEADEMRDFLVAVTLAAGKGESVDQDDLRNQVVSFASRLPKRMRANVEASLETGDGTGRSDACKMRLVVAQIAQAILHQSLIRLTPVCESKKMTTDADESFVVMPHELKCSPTGWSLTGTVTTTGGSQPTAGHSPRNLATKNFPLREYTVVSPED
jgi:predicted DNA-binding transcriptional regulator YafY